MTDQHGLVHPVFAGRSVVLASASPRRAELLERLGVTAQIHPADIDETHLPGESAAEYVRRLALAKAHAVHAEVGGSIVIAADTIVVLPLRLSSPMDSESVASHQNERILGKPADASANAVMIEQLSGRTHHVLTGVAVMSGDGDPRVGVELTTVTFRELSRDDIDWYVATNEGLDKAGGYGIQGQGGTLVEAITGDPTNVIGLPLAMLIGLVAEE